MEREFSHLDSDGNVKMVDVSDKPDSFRVAEAYGRIRLEGETIKLIVADKMKKGNVLTTAKIAGIMAAKNTFAQIPLCHQIALRSVDIEFTLNEREIEVCSYINCIDKTGAEMEALNAVSTALLTIYDMCKAVDKGMVIEEIKLCSKSKRSV